MHLVCFVCYYACMHVYIIFCLHISVNMHVIVHLCVHVFSISLCVCVCVCVFLLTSNNYYTINLLTVILSHVAGTPYSPS